MAAASSPALADPTCRIVPREHRQQRGRPGEQHREQVERDRRQHQPVVTDVAEAIEDALDRLAIALRRRLRHRPIRKIELNAIANNAVDVA